ncbi:MAG: hypothetical protein NTV13_04155 [Actinobacteria bacterium]|nr:hypothetical protein [Actinomycetota bacterium]
MNNSSHTQTTSTRTNIRTTRHSFYIIQSRGTCSFTEKQCYTFTEARHAALIKRRKEHTNHGEYRCPDCTFWHIGSTSVGGK